jgi:oligopeptide/dipeptide ABC transporter ATP-binding protein
VAWTADRGAVMYAGLIVEQAVTKELFHRPGHPCTQALLAAVPRLDCRRRPGEELATVSGQVPTEPMGGCLFRDRCPAAREQCLAEPPWVEVSPEHQVRCWNYP